jgi:FkbM family methyltransferase
MSKLLHRWLAEAITARKLAKESCKKYNINGFEMTSYSQQGEDVGIIKDFMPKIDQVRDGTFVELGGYNGITYSNTKGIEDTFGFKGVLIEPSDAYVAMDINRINTQNFRAAISTEDEVQFLGSDAIAGTLKNLTQNATDGAPITYKKTDPTPYTVKGRPISSILQESKLKYIDLFFIDVEGSEIDVIKTMDWSIPVYIICIEMHPYESRRKEQVEIRKTLTDKGFTYKKKIAEDEIWVNDSYFRKDKFV